VVSRNWHLASVSEASSYFSVFPHAAVSTTSQVGENSVLSSCGCVVYSGRSRPAEERGARIETYNSDKEPEFLKCRPAEERGARIETASWSMDIASCSGRPAEERGARIETSLGTSTLRVGAVAPQKNAGRGLKLRRLLGGQHYSGRPAEERGARIETDLAEYHVSRMPRRPAEERGARIETTYSGKDEGESEASPRRRTRGAD